MKANKAKCDICPLLPNVFVPSEIHDSKIIVLVEAPGYTETLEGKPLMGVAGQDLNKIIEEAGQKREFASYINSVSCRPTEGTNNRTPTTEEIDCCNERLIYEIEQINPIVIVAMGRIPYIALGGKIHSGFLMSDVAGSSFMFRDYKVIVTYHPAAISHSGGFNSSRGIIISKNIKNVLEEALKVKPVEKQLRLL